MSPIHRKKRNRTERKQGSNVRFTGHYRQLVWTRAGLQLKQRAAIKNRRSQLRYYGSVKIPRTRPKISSRCNDGSLGRPEDRPAVPKERDAQGRQTVQYLMGKHKAWVSYSFKP
ncbi:unnamed protein product [Calypogeia fissa]